MHRLVNKTGDPEAYWGVFQFPRAKVSKLPFSHDIQYNIYTAQFQVDKLLQYDL